MKIKPDDYEKLRDAVRKVLSAHPHLAASYETVNLSFKRFVWDVLLLTGLRIGDGAGAPGGLNLYAYMNDEHIETALKVAVKACGVRAW